MSLFTEDNEKKNPKTKQNTKKHNFSFVLW